MEFSPNYDFTWAHWQRLFRDLWRRTILPWQHVTFVVYLFVGIIIFGALGVWVEVVKWVIDPRSTSGISVAMVAFYPALVGTAALQLVYEATDHKDKIRSALSQLALVVFFGAAVLTNTFSQSHPHRVLAWNTLFSILAVWVWILASGGQRFLQSGGVDDETGGDPGRDLLGNLRGIET